MMRKKVLAAAVLSAVVALSGVGVVSTAATPTTLTLTSFEGIKSWGVLEADWSVQTIFREAVYDTILKEAANGAIVPNVASKFYYADKAKQQLVLEIRKGVKYSDGNVVSNRSVARSLRRYIDPANNAHALKAVDDITSVDTKAPNKVILNLKQPNPGLTLYLARQAGLLSSPAYWGTPSEKAYPVGSGPYILDVAKSQLGANYVFKSNPGYWNKKARKFDNLVIKIIGTQTALNTALQTGAVDGANLLENSAFATLNAAGVKSSSYVANVEAWRFSDRSGKLNSPIANLKVRQALNYAIDRKAILASPIGGGLGYVTTQEFPKGFDGYVASLENRYPYDPAKAKALLAEAGYPNGVKIASIQPFFFYFGPAKAILSAMLDKVGVTIDWIEAKPPALSAFAEAQAGKYPMFYQGLQRDPNWAFLNFSVMKDAPWNADDYMDSTMQKFIDQYRVGTPAVGKKALEQLNTYMVENALSIPIYVREGKYMHTSKIQITQRAGGIPSIWDMAPAA